MKRMLGFMAGLAAIVIVGVLAAPRFAKADDSKGAGKSGIDAKSAFARIKALAGTWNAKITDDHGAKEAQAKAEEHKGQAHKDRAPVIYKLTGGDSALVETQFPGSDHEMVSVYHLDGDELRMTHYCAVGNQPRVKLDRAKSTADHLIFVFDGGTNLDPQKDMHIHGVKITFHDDGKVTSAWEGYIGGRSAGTTTFELSRQKASSSSHPASTKPSSSL
jgi:hypothetical protein